MGVERKLKWKAIPVKLKWNITFNSCYEYEEKGVQIVFFEILFLKEYQIISACGIHLSQPSLE